MREFHTSFLSQRKMITEIIQACAQELIARTVELRLCECNAGEIEIVTDVKLLMSI
jgi:hypothetical protein